MKIGIMVVEILLFSLIFAAVPASAQECEDMITAFKEKTGAATYTTPKDETGLLTKLDDALTKLSRGKTMNAIQKLTDYISKVVALINQGKIFEGTLADGTIVTPQDLVAGVDAAIQCLSQ